MSNKNRLALQVEFLKLSDQALEHLKLAGIDRLDDFNTFNLKEIKALLAESFEEVLPTLIKYNLPTDVDNLSLSNDLVEILETSNIKTLEELVLFDKEQLFNIIPDPILLAEIHEFLTEYGHDIVEPDRKTQ